MPRTHLIFIFIFIFLQDVVPLVSTETLIRANCGPTIVTHLKMMLEVGVIPDLLSYNTLLAALAQVGLWLESKRVQTEMNVGHSKPNELSYSSLLHAYANGKQIECMCAFVEKVYSGEITLHPVLLKTLVLVNGKTNLVVETERAFVELIRRGYSLDLTTLKAMLSIYDPRQMVREVDEILDFVKENQCM